MLKNILVLLISYAASRFVFHYAINSVGSGAVKTAIEFIVFIALFLIVHKMVSLCKPSQTQA